MMDAQTPGPGPAEAAAAGRPLRGPAGALRAWTRDVIVSVAIAIFIIIFLYQPVRVEGTSMLPVLGDQERIFINKFVYHLEPIQRGDIVVFRYPRNPSKSYIKRVIGVAGDRVAIRGGKVYLNGEPLEEQYVPPAFFDFRNHPEVVVSPDSYYLLGDHRSMSNDSREFGPVHQSHIYGKAVFVYWPVERLGVLR